MKDFMVDKVDQFLNLQEAEIYEHAKRDVLTDPSLAEQRVVVEKMAELLSSYVDSDDICSLTTDRKPSLRRGWIPDQKTSLLREEIEETDNSDEGIGFFRGVFFGTLFSVAIWALILSIVL